MKKVLIPTSLNEVAKEMLEAHGGYTVVQVPKCDVAERVREHADVHALIGRGEKITDGSPGCRTPAQGEFARQRCHCEADRGGY